MTSKITISKPNSHGDRFITMPSVHGEIKLKAVDVFFDHAGKVSVGSTYGQAFANKAAKHLKPGQKLPWPRALLDRNGKQVVVASTEAIPLALSGPYIFALEIC